LKPPSTTAEPKKKITKIKRETKSWKIQGIKMRASQILANALKEEQDDLNNRIDYLALLRMRNNQR
jgi:hypothetical protein